MIIDIREIERLVTRMREINAIPLKEIEWRFDGEPVGVHAQALEDWRFVGMTNISFIETGAYRDGLETPTIAGSTIVQKITAHPEEFPLPL